MLLAIHVCQLMPHAQLQYQLQNRQGENENLSGTGARRWYLFKKLLILCSKKAGPKKYWKAREEE